MFELFCTCYKFNVEIIIKGWRLGRWSAIFIKESAWVVIKIDDLSLGLSKNIILIQKFG
jgi:hypothetical protein